MRFILILYLISLSLFARTDLLEQPSLELIPDFKSRVIVPSSKLSENELEELVDQVQKLEKENDVILQVLAFETIKPHTINEVMFMALEKLPFSQSEKERTILLIISFEEREIKIDYAKNLKLNKKVKNKIVTDILVPHLKENNFPLAIKKVITKIQKEVKPDQSPDLSIDFDYENIVTLREPIENYPYYLPIIIFLVLFPLIIKFVKIPSLFIPLLTSSIFGISSYIFYPKLEHILLCLVLGFLFGAIRSLNAIYFFLSNSDRGHKFKLSSKRYSLWTTKNEEIIGGGIAGDLDD